MKHYTRSVTARPSLALASATSPPRERTLLATDFVVAMPDSLAAHLYQRFRAISLP